MVYVLLITESATRVVFERPETSSKKPPAPVQPARPVMPPINEGRKQWGEVAGTPLVAMLQEKELQTATYAVSADSGT